MAPAIPTKPLRIATVLLLVGIPVGCPSTLQDPSRFAVDGACPDVPQTVFLPVCATAACHSTATKIQSLDLEAPGVAARLVGVTATEGGGLLIDPSSPPSSVLYTKVTSMPPFGVRMPFNAAPLDDATVACVLRWVTDQVNVGDSGQVADGTPIDDAAAESSPPDDGASGSGGDAATPEVDAGAPSDAQSSVAPPDAGSRKSGPDARAPTDAKAD